MLPRTDPAHTDRIIAQGKALVRAIEALGLSHLEVSSLIKSYRAKSHKVVPVKWLHIIISRQVDREKGNASW
jgi:hypothetical protein